MAIAAVNALEDSQNTSIAHSQNEFKLGARNPPASDAEVDDDHETKGPLRGRSESGTEGEID